MQWEQFFHSAIQAIEFLGWLSRSSFFYLSETETYLTMRNFFSHTLTTFFLTEPKVEILARINTLSASKYMTLLHRFRRKVFFQRNLKFSFPPSSYTYNKSPAPLPSFFFFFSFPISFLSTLIFMLWMMCRKRKIVKTCCTFFPSFRKNC